MTELSLPSTLSFGWRDALELLLVAVVAYRLLRLVQGAHSTRVMAAVAALAAGYVAAQLLGLTLVTYLLERVVTLGVFVLLVVFQPELRAGLARLGPSRVTRFFRTRDQGPVEDEIADAVERLSRSGVGAIIAIERDTPLDAYIESGSVLQARVSADLLATIFTPYSPLHDGAVIVRGDGIIGASCILPLSQAAITDRSFGTRHRAALGLSEETDALVIVVSEETAAISVAQGGVMQPQLSAIALRDLLAGRTPRSTAEHAVAMR